MGYRQRTTSPLPEGCVIGYRFNPYDKGASMVEVQNFMLPTACDLSASRNSNASSTARNVVTGSPSPQEDSLLHPSLVGKVAFYAFPTEAYPSPVPTLPKQALARVFFGQLPYNVTDMELSWLCGDFARGSQVFYNERIVKKSVKNKADRMPTGCVHTYCDARDLTMLIEKLDKRVLFDDCGLWYAEDPAQKAELDAYCAMMKENPSLRPADRPYQPVVVQPATSTYIPNLHKARQQSPPATPPPAYKY